MQSIIERLSQSLNKTQTLQEFIRSLLQMLGNAGQFESTYLTSLDEGKGLQQVVFAHNSSGLQITQGLRMRWNDSLCKRALEEGCMHAADVEVFWESCSTARELGIRSHASVPLRFSDGRLYGSLCAASQGKACLSEPLQALLPLFARLIAERLEREQLIETLDLRNRELAALALLDPLTGMPNRRCITDELGRLIARSARSDEWVLVGFIDLNRLKQVNDEHGHEVGDALLCAVSERLASCLRSGDMLARFGGDEFVFIGSGPTLAEDGDAVVRDLQQRLTQASNFSLELAHGLSLAHAGVSAGVVCLSPHATDAGDALQKADAAMYRIKAQASGQAC
ncbi:sensor domain-containing diguanylate cyclase [Comamonas composti]|uniref:sensor domain-containing diguanylate cyclase n=1 Tax=Comamonas composti TaxID=408558 RepID=UPI00040574EA|nr:sensor domain-containing diguanylate cyclase [Comamonas composti]